MKFHKFDRIQSFEAAGLTDVALRLYENPDEAIRLVGGRVMPAFS
jgi:hypothetical protein